jgi:protein tyrosine phosphatase (PTP) superfamily phosphohydrolase (DUF442 family)
VKRALPWAVGVVAVVVIVVGYAAWPLLARRRTTPVPSPAPTGPQAFAERLDLPGVPNFHRVTDDLYRGAQPSRTGFRELDQMGIRTVVNLRWYRSDRARLADTGLHYEHVGIKGWSASVGHAIQFLRIATDKRRTPVFVYCENGADRTSFVCAAYRVVVCGWSKEDAIREMTDSRFGADAELKDLPERIRDMEVERVRSFLSEGQ